MAAKGMEKRQGMALVSRKLDRLFEAAEYIKNFPKTLSYGIKEIIKKN